MKDDHRCYICGKPPVFVVLSQDDGPLEDSARVPVCGRENCIKATVGLFLMLCSMQPCVDLLRVED